MTRADLLPLNAQNEGITATYVAGILEVLVPLAGALTLGVDREVPRPRTSSPAPAHLPVRTAARRHGRCRNDLWPWPPRRAAPSVVAGGRIRRAGRAAEGVRPMGAFIVVAAVVAGVYVALMAMYAIAIRTRTTHLLRQPDKLDRPRQHGARTRGLPHPEPGKRTGVKEFADSFLGAQARTEVIDAPHRATHLSLGGAMCNLRLALAAEGRASRLRPRPLRQPAAGPGEPGRRPPHRVPGGDGPLNPEPPAVARRPRAAGLAPRITGQVGAGRASPQPVRSAARTASTPAVVPASASTIRSSVSSSNAPATVAVPPWTATGQRRCPPAQVSRRR